MTRIFINYRRDDAAGVAGRLYDHLVSGFSRAAIFMDVDTMKPGRDFLEQIDEEIAGCDAVLAIIGQRWLTAADEKGRRRIDNSRDYVRLELAAALKRGIPVVPILVDGAHIPSEDDLPDELKPLVRRQALELRNTRFAADSDAIVHALRQTLPRKRTKWLWLTIVATGFIVLGITTENELASYLQSKEKPVPVERKPLEVPVPAETPKPTSVGLARIKTLSVALGDTYDQVKAAYPGAADDGYGALRMPLDGLILFFDRDGKRLRQIRADAPFIGSINGVHIGDSADDVVARLGQPYTISHDRPPLAKDGTTISKDGTSFLYKKDGNIIRYDFDQSSKVETISAMWERW